MATCSPHVLRDFAVFLLKRELHGVVGIIEIVQKERLLADHNTHLNTSKWSQHSPEHIKVVTTLTGTHQSGHNTHLQS